MKTRRFGDSLTTAGEAKPELEKPTLFDLLTRLVLPLALVIIAQLQTERARFWGLLAFALFSVLVSFYGPVSKGVRGWIRKRRDQRLARRQFPELRKFARRFGDFANVGRNDTLHEIVLSELCSRDATKLQKFGIPPARLFSDLWSFFYMRVQNQEPRLNDLVQSTREFASLVSSYCVHCVLPVFDQFPQELRPLLTDGAKSSLESFRERFVSFLDSYGDYLKNLDDSLSSPRIQWYYFSRPKPL